MKEMMQKFALMGAICLGALTGVKHGEQSLRKDTDYEVSCLDNINVGTAKAIVKGLDVRFE